MLLLDWFNDAPWELKEATVKCLRVCETSTSPLWAYLRAQSVHQTRLLHRTPPISYCLCCLSVLFVLWVLSVHASVCLSVCLSFWLSVCLSVYLCCLCCLSVFFVLSVYEAGAVCVVSTLCAVCALCAIVTLWLCSLAMLSGCAVWLCCLSVCAVRLCCRCILCCGCSLCCLCCLSCLFVCYNCSMLNLIRITASFLLSASRFKNNEHVDCVSAVQVFLQ